MTVLSCGLHCPLVAYGTGKLGAHLWGTLDLKEAGTRAQVLHRVPRRGLLFADLDQTVDLASDNR